MEGVDEKLTVSAVAPPVMLYARQMSAMRFVFDCPARAKVAPVRVTPVADGVLFGAPPKTTIVFPVVVAGIVTGMVRPEVQTAVV